MTSLAGTGALVRFILRRDRIRLSAWTAAILVFAIPSVASLADLYPTAAERQARASLADNPAFVLFTGPGHGIDNYTFGAMVANEILGFLMLLLAFMSIFLVVRHTRAEEQLGRSELVRAAVVGRFAQPVASLIVVGGLNVLIGGIIALTFPALPGLDLTTTGSFTFAFAAVSVGLTFAGVALLASQISEYSRGATGLACAMVGITYFLRAVGDIGNGVLSWLSPFGWGGATQAYVDDQVWPALLGLVAAIAVTWVALTLSAHRDVGSGLVAVRRGQADAAPRLATPIGFAVRAQRGALIGWSAGVVAFAAIYGSVVGEVESFVEGNEAVQDFIDAGGGSMLDAFLGTVILLLAVVLSGYAIQSTLRARSEESAGRAEPVLATGLSRRRWVGGYLVVSLAASALIMVVAGMTLGLTAAIALDDWDMFGRLTVAAVAYVPALWVTTGVAVALFGLVPRWSSAVWALVAYAISHAMLSGLLGFPDWTARLTPFGNVPTLPVEDFSAMATVGLLAVAASLVALGLYGFTRRDVETT